MWEPLDSLPSPQNSHNIIHSYYRGTMRHWPYLSAKIVFSRGQTGLLRLWRKRFTCSGGKGLTKFDDFSLKFHLWYSPIFSFWLCLWTGRDEFFPLLFPCPTVPTPQSRYSAIWTVLKSVQKALNRANPFLAFPRRCWIHRRVPIIGTRRCKIHTYCTQPSGHSKCKIHICTYTAREKR